MSISIFSDREFLRGHTFRIIIFGLLLLFVPTSLAVSPRTAYAGQATLTWNAPTTNTNGTPLTDLAGYKLYYGTASRSYLSNINVGNATTYTFPNLSNGTYYFAVTAYDSAGIESAYSNEVSKTLQAVQQDTLTVTKLGSGSGTVTSSPSGINCGASCSAAYNQSSVVTLAASPATGSTFTGWSGGVCTGSGTCSFSLTANTTVTATFANNTTPSTAYTITASAGLGGTISPSGAVAVNSSASQTFTITPNTGYRIAGVTADGVSVGAVSSYTLSSVTANHTIAATFAQNTYTVTPSAGANGSISPSTAQTVNYSATTSFTVTPNSGYSIASVTGCGGTLSGSTYTTGPITASCTVTASFAVNFTSNTTLFSDDFTRPVGSTNPLSPWVAAMGTWTVTGGVMKGTGSANQYSYAYVSGTPQWTDYTVQGRIQIPAGSFGGGIGGRVDPTTGAHYGAWVYPAGSPGGSNLLKLWKFRGWTDVGAGPMQQVSLPDVGTGWHTLQMTFKGNNILVYYDGVLQINVTDNNAPYLSGGISTDWWTSSPPYTITVDGISVVAQ